LLKLAKMTNLKAQQFIQDEFKRRTDLINDQNFINISIEMAKEFGITAKEWNENTFAILALFANEVCALQNK
jgi:hypothetical protein